MFLKELMERDERFHEGLIRSVVFCLVIKETKTSMIQTKSFYSLSKEKEKIELFGVNKNFY